MHEQARRMLRSGKTVRQVAAETGLSRKEVEDIAWNMKKARMKRNWFIFNGTLLLVALFLAYCFGWKPYHQARQKMVERRWAANVRKAADVLESTFLQNFWVLETESPSPAHFHVEMNFIKSQTERLAQALENNLAIPEVVQIKAAFPGGFLASIFSKEGGGISKVLTAGRLQEFRLPEHGIEVCFVPKDALSHRKIRGRILHYSQEWRALMVGALEYPDPRWFDALVIHELYHALMHKQGSPSATAPMFSDLWIAEELQAHKLEDAILDRGTSGAYLTTIKRIASQVKARTVPEFLSQITSDHLLEIDDNFVKSSRREGQIRASQYLISLTNHWLVIRYNDPRPLGEQAKAYKLITQNL